LFWDHLEDAIGVAIEAWQFPAMSDEPFPLAAEFPATSREAWRKLVEAALRGGSYEKRLIRHTYDGLRVEPLYPRAAGASVVAGRGAEPWQIMQRVDHPDSAAANAQALIDLENGATGLSLVFADSAGAYGYGLDGGRPTVTRVFDGIHVDAGIALELDQGQNHAEAATAVAAYVRKRGVDPAATRIRFGLDPLGAAAMEGRMSTPWHKLAAGFAGRVAELAGQGFKGPFAVADGRIIHAAGGSEAQELAFVIANAVAYCRALGDAGISLDDARGMIFFRLAADADEFLTIAKFRALRKLWARVEQVSGLTPRPAFVSAETAWRMMTARDPYVNMLRTTIAVTASGLGGADAVTALPFTLALGLPDRFARRVARNMQLVLLEESNLFRVADPAAGAGGIEALTEGIAKTAWGLFQEIEAAGGAAAALAKGVLQKHVAAVRAEREAAVARRKETITGVSDYPHLAELPVEVLDVARLSAPPTRLAAPFEALRDRSDAILRKTGARPKVFLANLGRLADFTVRATFARNFYEAGGIEAITNDGFSDQAEMMAAFKASGARLACLCSTDQVYATQAADAAKALAQAGAIVHLAGRPGEHETAWRQAGVKEFIYVSCNVLTTLQAVHAMLSQ
jgi:methylmalonyl-CoA mutase